VNRSESNITVDNLLLYEAYFVRGKDPRTPFLYGVPGYSIVTLTEFNNTIGSAFCKAF